MSPNPVAPLENLAVVLVRWQREQLPEEDLRVLLAVAVTVLVVDNAERAGPGTCSDPTPGSPRFGDALMRQAARLGVGCARWERPSGAAQARSTEPVDSGPARLLLLENANRGLLAGAYNLALDCLHRQPDPPRHVLWLDEDSDLSALVAWLGDPETRSHFDRPDIAAFAPAYRDRATGLRGRQMVWAGPRLRFAEREARACFDTAFLINSMSIWRLDVLQSAGGYDEALALDHIDTDLCLWAHHRGYRLVLCGGHEFRHAIGERRAYRLGRHVLQATGHPPWRRHSLARTTVVLARRYGWRWPSFLRLCVWRLGYEGVGIWFAEDHKVAKSWALIRGFMAGLIQSTARRSRFGPE